MAYVHVQRQAIKPRTETVKRNETKQNEMKLNSEKPGDHAQPHLSMLVMVNNCMVAVKGSYKH